MFYLILLSNDNKNCEGTLRKKTCHVHSVRYSKSNALKVGLVLEELAVGQRTGQCKQG